MLITKGKGKKAKTRWGKCHPGLRGLPSAGKLGWRSVPQSAFPSGVLDWAQGGMAEGEPVGRLVAAVE